jgi:hypothetical protein
VRERVKPICILLLNLLTWAGGLLLRVSHTHLYSISNMVCCLINEPSHHTAIKRLPRKTLSHSTNFIAKKKSKNKY